MKRLVILGGGHAGSSAALSAAKVKKDWNANEVEITLIDKNPYQTIKPRLYEYELEEAMVPYRDFLPQAGVEFCQDEIEQIDLDAKKLIGHKDTYAFDALLISAGSKLNQSLDTFNIDSYQEALKLREAWENQLKNQSDRELQIAILGAGFTGIELATELPLSIHKFAKMQNLPTPKFRITLLDRGEVGASLGEDPKEAIQKALQMAKIQSVSGANLTQVENHVVYYTDQANKTYQQEFDLIINTMGQRPNPLTQLLPVEKDVQQRIVVGSTLAVPQKPYLFAAGDVASVWIDETHKALMTCQQGRPQGRYAGYNAMAFLTGRQPVNYAQPHYVTCLDLGNYGALYTEGWDRKIRFDGAEAKKYKRHINQDRIYPPATGDPVDLYEAGKLQFRSVLETVKESRFA